MTQNLQTFDIIYTKDNRIEYFLEEYTPKKLKISKKNIKMLISNFSDKIKIKPAMSEEYIWDEGWYLINPRQYVGRISLPDIVLHLNPKVHISNLFYMISYVYDLDLFREEIVYYEESSESDIFEFLVRFFNKTVTELIKRGKLKYYREIEENTRRPRGKILIYEHVKENIIRSKSYIFCSHDEYTADIIENQIIKYVLYILSTYSYKDKSLHDDIVENYYRLEDVSLNVITNFPIIMYTERNRYYEPIHNLCRMFLDNIYISEISGYNEFLSFLIDMNKLFETFISKLLSKKAGNIDGVQIFEQPRYYLDIENQIGLEPDNLILKNYVLKCPLDTKYKKIGRYDFKGYDICTALKYCTGINLKKAILLYPKWENVRKEVLKINNSDIEIAVMTIDLTGNIDTFNKNLDNLIKDIFEFAEVS